MNQLADRWHVNANATDTETSPILVRDPVWNCFALADLEPPLRAYSQFALASYDGGKAWATCLILRHPIIGEVLSPSGHEEGIAAILREIALPEHPLLQVQEAHVPLLQHSYQPEPETSWGRLLRMALVSASWLPQESPSPRPVQQLTLTDLPALQDFYSRHVGGRLSADLFAQGLYFGAYEGNRIIAAGGTHALAHRSHLAVLGNILTAPAARRKGYATAITSTLVAKLFEQGFSPVILNVFADNVNAIRVYQRLGFQTHHRLVTGKGVLRHDRM